MTSTENMGNEDKQYPIVPPYIPELSLLIDFFIERFDYQGQNTKVQRQNIIFSQLYGPRFSQYETYDGKNKEVPESAYIIIAYYILRDKMSIKAACVRVLNEYFIPYTKYTEQKQKDDFIERKSETLRSRYRLNKQKYESAANLGNVLTHAMTLNEKLSKDEIKDEFSPAYHKNKNFQRLIDFGITELGWKV